MPVATKTTVIEIPPGWADQVEREIGALRDAQATLRTDIATGVADGIKAILADDATVQKFWRRGYDELADHAGNGASQWLGKRILTSFVLAVVVAGLTWLLKSGALK
jgi:hypothetical protein